MIFMLLISLVLSMNEAQARYITEQAVDSIFILDTGEAEISSNCLSEDGPTFLIETMEEVIVEASDETFYTIEIALQLLSVNDDAEGTFTISTPKERDDISVEIIEGTELEEGVVKVVTAEITMILDEAFEVDILWSSTEGSSQMLYATFAYETEEVGIPIEDIEDISILYLKSKSENAVLNNAEDTMIYQITSDVEEYDIIIYRYDASQYKYIALGTDDVGIRYTEDNNTVVISRESTAESGAYKIEVSNGSRSESEVFYVTNDNYVGGMDNE